MVTGEKKQVWNTVHWDTNFNKTQNMGHGKHYFLNLI